MNKKNLVITTIIIMGMFLCRDKFSGSNRGHFTWKGHYKNSWGTRTVNCNSTCTACSAYVTAGKKEIIDYSSYKQVYEYCENYTRYTPPDNDQVDTTITTVKPTGKLVFDSAATTVYGFDSWRDANVINDADKINYVSVAAGCSTFVKIMLPEEMFSAYWKIVAKLPSASSNGISFTNVGTTDSLLLTDTVTYIPIYAKISATLNTPISMEVIGIDDPAQPVTLAGNKYGSEDKLEIIVYEESVLLNYKLYTYGSFNPSSSEWENGLNPYLKQVVMRMDSLVTYPVSDMLWDINENNILDLWPEENIDSVPDSMKDEVLLILELLGETNELNGCYYDNIPVSITLPNQIRMNWIIDEDANTGDGFIILHTIEGLDIGDQIILGPWTGQNMSNSENAVISNIDTTASIVFLQDSLIHDYSKHDVCFINDYASGVTIGSCSCIKDAPAYQTITHEYYIRIELVTLSMLKKTII